MLSTLLRKVRPRSVYDVFAVLAFFIAVGTGGAYAANTIRSTDIVDGEVTSADVANQNLTGGDIKDNSISSFDIASLVGDDVVDGTLDDRDIGKTASTNVSGNFGTVAAHTCVRQTIEVTIGPRGDHLILTPNYDTTPPFIEFTVQSQTGTGAQILACNPTNNAITVGAASFNLLVIGAR